MMNRVLIPVVALTVAVTLVLIWPASEPVSMGPPPDIDVVDPVRTAAEEGVGGEAHALSRAVVSDNIHYLEVRNVSGEAIDSAECVLLSSEEGLVRPASGRQGCFEVMNGSSGDILVSAPGYMSKHVSVSLIDSVVVLEFARTIEFRCRYADGTAAVNAAVFVRSGAPAPEFSSWEDVRAAIGSFDEPTSHALLSDDQGLAVTSRMDRDGPVFYSAFAEGLVGTHPSGAASVVKGPVVDLVFVEMGAAGIEFVGPGEVVSSSYSVKGGLGSGLSVPFCGAIIDGIKERNPGAVIATSILDPNGAGVSAVFSVWHTHAGWCVEDVPVVRESEFDPLSIVVDADAAPAPYGALVVRVVGESGDPVECGHIALMAGGRRSTLKLPSRIDPELRGKAMIYMGLPRLEGELGVYRFDRLPPGEYLLISYDATVSKVLNGLNSKVVVEDAGTQDVTLQFKKRAAPLAVAFSGADDWDTVGITASAGGRTWLRVTMRRDQIGEISWPWIPCGESMDVNFNFVPGGNVLLERMTYDGSVIDVVVPDVGGG